VDPEAERNLVERAKSSPEAFGEIFDMYYERILAYALKRTADPDVAADIAAEVFAKALKNIGWFTWRGIPLSAWLYRIAGNEVKMYFRHQKYVPTSLNTLLDAGYDPSDSDLTAERRELEKEIDQSGEERRLLKSLAVLTCGEQDLLALRYFEGMKTREMAELLNKPEGTVRSMLSRAVRELRKVFEDTQQKPNSRIIGSEGRSGLLLQITEL
jgi:RNA polymerase sigma-70 factor (ECF subfamily)